MNRYFSLFSCRNACLTVLFFTVIFAMACAGTGDKSTDVAPGPVYATDLSPLAPQPDPNALKPGLAVVYFRSFKFKKLDLLPSGNFAKQVGRPGKPISELNHAFGKGVVFDSGQKEMVGMRINGLVNFSQTGQYVLQAMSNDGIRVYVDDKRVIDDGKWQKQGDRMSLEAFLDIKTAGWYRLQVEYFQLRGTSTIKLFWRTPENQELLPIPPEAYAHL